MDFVPERQYNTAAILYVIACSSNYRVIIPLVEKTNLIQKCDDVVWSIIISISVGLHRALMSLEAGSNVVQ